MFLLLIIQSFYYIYRRGPIYDYTIHQPLKSAVLIVTKAVSHIDRNLIKR